MLKRYSDEISRIAGRYIHVMPELSVFKQRLLLTAYYKPVAENAYIQGVLAERERAAEKPEVGRIATEKEEVRTLDLGVIEASVSLGKTAGFVEQGAEYLIKIDDPDTGKDEFYVKTQDEIYPAMHARGHWWWKENEHKSIGSDWEDVPRSDGVPPHKMMRFGTGKNQGVVRIYAKSRWTPAGEMFDHEHALLFAAREAERAINKGLIEAELREGMRKLLDAGARAYAERKKGS